jgi:hypothetical protein
MIWVAVSVFILCASLILAQHELHSFKREQMEWMDNVQLGKELEAAIAEFQEYKAKVDTLTLRVGIQSKPLK